MTALYEYAKLDWPTEYLQRRYGLSFHLPAAKIALIVAVINRFMHDTMRSTAYCRGIQLAFVTYNFAYSPGGALLRYA